MYSLHSNCCVYPFPSINSLPVELLSEIFNICALSPCDPDNIHSPPLISSQSVLVPLALSSVNRQWRSVAISQPSLWSNICVTPELLEWEANANKDSECKLNTAPIRTYLSRSRKYPLNILIEGRDPGWDFSEQDVGIDFGFGNTASDPLFSSDNMEAALSVLLPHITRWRYLTILTDTWAPMYIALQLINPGIRRSGAPILESLSLRRCNDYVSYSSHFQPRHLNDIGFLTPKNSNEQQARASLLPRLKHLHLCGVHADWDSLVSVLEASQTCGLSFLGLASHSKEVRPSMGQFHKLLKSTPGLQMLSVVGTGPDGPGSEDDSAHNYEPVCLPHLRDITVGYRGEAGGRSLLHFLDAPNAQSLVLEDTTYPADPTDINAGPILTYLGTKQCNGNEHTFPGVVGAPTEKRRKRSICVPHMGLDIEPQCRSACPLLRRVALRNVKSSFQPLATFFNSLTNVTHLELSGMSMLSIHALVPCSHSLSDDVPCPQLHSLILKDSDFNVEDLNFIVTGLSPCREARGAPELRDLRFHVKPSRSRDVNLLTAAAASSRGSLNIQIISDDFEFEDNLVVDEEAEAAAFSLGGAFNDPGFDAYYHDVNSISL